MSLQEVDTFELVAALRTSVDCFSWGVEVSTLAELMSDKATNKFHWGNFLIDDMEAGLQRQPIIINVNGAEEFDIEGWVVGNGNHRLAIAIALMLPTVLVFFNEDPSDCMMADEFGW